MTEAERDRDSKDDEAFLALLRRASPPATPPANFLDRIQRQIRRRTRGKYFADSPVPGGSSLLLYVLLALLALTLVTLFYFAVIVPQSR